MIKQELVLKKWVHPTKNVHVHILRNAVEKRAQA